MKNIREFIESGILESYVMGLTTPKETEEVELMAASSFEVREEIEAINISLEEFAKAKSIVPNPAIRSLIMASIDYSERIKNGEKSHVPPILNAASQKSEYAEWLNRPDMVPSENLQEIEAKIIGKTKETVTAIVWIKYMLPQEVHHNELERFLIIEGTCDVFMDDKIYSFSPGDVFTIPQHKNHYAKVTSDIPCKAIVQRILVQEKI
jgi:mannose-6-phosphate isomerase-like protein (cupin superfamily)